MSSRRGRRQGAQRRLSEVPWEKARNEMARRRRRRSARRRPGRGPSRGVPWAFVVVLAALILLTVVVRTLR